MALERVANFKLLGTYCTSQRTCPGLTPPPAAPVPDDAEEAPPVFSHPGALLPLCDRASSPVVYHKFLLR